MPVVRVAIAQLNQTVGALEANVAAIQEYAAKGEAHGAQLMVCPELSIPGYPPEDLVLKPSFVAANRAALERVAANTGAMPILVGFVDREDGMLYDAAAVLQEGRIVAVYRKAMLPNYGVFDEKRYFTPGSEALVLESQAGRIGVTICEDIWLPHGPYLAESQAGACLIVNLSASPYHREKWKERQRLIAARARESQAALVYANLVGGQDELVFDGFSLVADGTGRILAQGRGFTEELMVVDIPLEEHRGAEEHSGVRIVPLTLPPHPGEGMDQPRITIPSSPEEEVYEALVLATHDYVGKNGFSDAIIGLSGGIDSAVVASIAVDALSSRRVHCLFMPSEFTSRESYEDAEAVARNLGISLETIPIDDMLHAYCSSLARVFAGTKADTTEENLQARIRGNLLMALSNKLGYLVLTTGNKSEMACGYATLYGDMAGGFAVIKDVLKTMVFRLVAYRNARQGGPWLPDRLLTKAPSAELRYDQKDSDSLPPYDVLDPILEAYVEQDLSIEAIVARGFPRDTVRRVARLVDRAEYKRRQAPPGVKITAKAFGRDRRLPITNRFSNERP
ncbi:NAD+ synthase [Candidatus Fermentibacteria bacterium]|nr:NAD+ synthase [Candidatus Fermentibacteria bacterium]